MEEKGVEGEADAGVVYDTEVYSNDQVEQVPQQENLADGVTDPVLRGALEALDTAINNVPFNEAAGSFSGPGIPSLSQAVGDIMAEQEAIHYAETGDESSAENAEAISCADAVVSARKGNDIEFDGKKYRFHVKDDSRDQDYDITELKRNGSNLSVKLSHTDGSTWEMTLAGKDKICAIKSGSLNVSLNDGDAEATLKKQ